MERIANRLREARQSAGFPTPEDFAGRVGVDAAIYRGYEEGTRYMSPQLGYRLAQVLGVNWVDLLYGPEYTDDAGDYGWQGIAAGRRRPRQAMQEIAYVGGGTEPAYAAPATAGGRTLAVRSRPGHPTPDPADFDRPRLAVAAVEAPPPLRATPALGRDRDAVSVDELDTQLASGAGISRAAQHPLTRWSLPREVIKTGARAASADLKMLTILGDEMEPGLRMNDRILIDTSDTRPSPAGIFVVWDGMSLVVRRIELVPGSEPVLLRISTDNPKYQTVERGLAETLIQGRVIAKWSWV